MAPLSHHTIHFHFGRIFNDIHVHRCIPDHPCIEQHPCMHGRAYLYMLRKSHSLDGFGVRSPCRNSLDWCFGSFDSRMLLASRKFIPGIPQVQKSAGKDHVFFVPTPPSNYLLRFRMTGPEPPVPVRYESPSPDTTNGTGICTLTPGQPTLAVSRQSYGSPMDRRVWVGFVFVHLGVLRSSSSSLEHFTRAGCWPRARSARRARTWPPGRGRQGGPP